MSAPPLFHAARKGDRVSHDAAMATRSQSVVAAFVGQALAACGQAGVLCAQAGAAASSGAASGVLSILELLPRSSTGIIAEASPTVLVAPGIGAALALAHPVECALHHGKPIAPPVASVLVQGFPLALTGGQTTCGALLCDGVPAILVGGVAANGGGSGAVGGSPVADAIALAGALAGRVTSAVAAATRGAELIEQTVRETISRVEVTVHTASGALSALTGALVGLTSGGVLGALTGATLAGSEDP